MIKILEKFIQTFYCCIVNSDISVYHLSNKFPISIFIGTNTSDQSLFLQNYGCVIFELFLISSNPRYSVLTLSTNSYVLVVLAQSKRIKMTITVFLIVKK